MTEQHRGRFQTPFENAIKPSLHRRNVWRYQRDKQKCKSKRDIQSNGKKGQNDKQWFTKKLAERKDSELWCLTLCSPIFQLYRGGQFYWWRKQEYPEKTGKSKTTDNYLLDIVL